MTSPHKEKVENWMFWKRSIILTMKQKHARGTCNIMCQFKQIVHFVKLSQSEWDQMLMVYLTMASWKELHHEFVDRDMRD